VVSDEPLRAINWSGVRSWLPEPEAGDRVVATLLFTDIVASTETAVRLGDRAWRELLGRHNRDVRDQLDRFRGREIDTTGDGFLAVF
jgi:class 3 adenylate cyclase